MPAWSPSSRFEPRGPSPSSMTLSDELGTRDDGERPRWRGGPLKLGERRIAIHDGHRQIRDEHVGSDDIEDGHVGFRPRPLFTSDTLDDGNALATSGVAGPHGRANLCKRHAMATSDVSGSRDECLDARRLAPVHRELTRSEARA